MLQEKLDKIKEYFQSIELLDMKWVICVKYKPKWGAYPSDDNRIQAIPDESVPCLYWYYSNDTKVSVDEIIDLIEETVQTNLDAIKKAELFKLKVDELKKLFSNENLTFSKLQTLNFTFSENITDESVIVEETIKKRGRRKISSKKDLLKVGEIEEEKLPNNELEALVNDKVDGSNGDTEIVESSDMTQEEIDDLRG